MKISLIVPVFGPKRVLQAFLEQLANSLSPEVSEIVIIDDCSPDSLESVVRQFADQMTTITVFFERHPENMGRAQARNTGIALASGELLFFLDVDNHPMQGAFSSVARHFLDRNIGCVRGNVRCENAQVQRSAYVRFFDSRYLGFRLKKSQTISFRYFATDAVCIRKNILDLVGGFDLRFKYYGCEDEELGVRIEKIGTNMLFAADAEFIDTDTPTLARESKRMSVYAEKSVPILLRIHPEHASKTLFSALEDHSTIIQRIIRKILLLILQPSLASILAGGLLKIDSLGYNIPRAFYFYVLAASYCRGVRMRPNS